MWHMTCDTWYATRDTWHVTWGGGWTFSQKFSSTALQVWNRQFHDDSEHPPLVHWYTCRPTHIALKTSRCSRLNPWKVHASEVFGWWTGAFVSLKSEESFRIELIFLVFKKKILRFLSASVERFGVSRIRDVLKTSNKMALKKVKVCKLKFT